MAVIRRSLQAEADLETILDDLEQKDPSVADRYAAEFTAKTQVLAHFPESGRPRPEIAPNLRSTLVNPYLIFYRLKDGEIHILRILHGKRDLQRIMRKETDR